MIHNATEDGPKLSIAKINALVEPYRSEKSKHNQEWRLNKAFYEGQHFVRLSKLNGRLDFKKDPEATANPWKVRIPINLLRAHIDSLAGKLNKQNPIMDAQVMDNSLSSIRAKRIAEALFDQKSTELNFPHVRERVINMGLVFGEGWSETFWNAAKGEKRKVAIDPDTGREAAGPRLDYLKRISEANPEDPNSQLQWEERPGGDIDIEYLMPSEVIMIGDRDPRKAVGAVKIKGYDQDTAYARWPLLREKKVKPAHQVDPDLGNPDDNERAVIEIRALYWLPDKEFPKGKYMVWTGSMMLEEKDYPYAHNRLPFSRFAPSLKVGSEETLSEAGMLRPLMKSFNKQFAQALEHQNVVVSPMMSAPFGSIQGEIHMRPGALIEYSPINGQKPEWYSAPPLASFVGELLDRMAAAMKEVSGADDITQGRVPDQMTRMDSSFAINFVNENAEVRQIPKYLALESWIADVGNLILLLAQKYYTHERLMKVPGPYGMAEAQAIKNSDFEGVAELRVIQGSTVPHSKAAQVQMAKEMLDGGHLRIDQYLRLAEVANRDELMGSFIGAQAKQQREIDKILKVLEEDQEREVLGPPSEADNHAAHLEVLEMLFNAPEWDEYDEKQRAVLEAHWKAHKSMLGEQNRPQSEPPSVRVQHTTQAVASPSESAAILAAAGIEVDPEAITDEQKGRMSYEARQEATGGGTIDPMAPPPGSEPEVGAFGGGVQ